MASLTVDTSQLRSFAATVQEIGNTTGFGPALPSCVSAKQVATDFISLPLTETGVLYFDLVRKTENIRDSLLGVLESFTTAMTVSSTELYRTADEYDTDDDEAASALDAAYQDCFTGTSTGVNRWSQAVYTSVPKSVMTMEGVALPSDQREPVDYVTDILTTDWTSPSEAINQLISFFFNYDPVEEVTHCFTGDWNSLYRAAEAMENLGDYFGGVGTYIPMAASQGINSWTGNVADSALRYFSKLGDECKSWQATMASPVDSCRFVAGSMQTWAFSISSLLTTIMDALIVAVITAVGGLALIETVVGAVIAWLGTIGAIVVIAYNVNKAWNELLDVAAAVNGLAAALLAYSQLAVPGTVTFSMPMPYDNALVS